MKIKYFLFAVATMLVACNNEPENPNGPGTSTNPDTPSTGLYIINEGMYGSPSASLSFYNPETDVVTNNVFHSANGYILGDVASSMTIINGQGWISVNNSGIIYIFDLSTYKEKGRIQGINSPRYICQASGDKVYISQMYSNVIKIVDAKTYKITGSITVPEMDMKPSFMGGSTEEMIKVGDYVYCNCWSYQRDLIKIDTKTDKVVATLDLGVQPKSIALSDDTTLWVLVDGGSWNGNPAGYEAPKLVAVDLAEFKVKKSYELPLGDSVAHLECDGNYLYWLENGVQRMAVDATELPSEAFIPSTSWSLYSLTVSESGDIYVADAIDYTQSGTVTRYDSEGNEVSIFMVGVCPANLCWKN